MADLILPSRINDLKSLVKAECQRRSKTGSVAKYGGTAYDYSTPPATGKLIAAEHREKLAVPLRAINSSKVTETETKITDADLLNMEAFVTTLKASAMANKNSTDCSASCTGLCYSCTGTCTSGCTSCTGCSSCSGCSGSCWGTCEEDCEYSCWWTSS